MATEEKVSDENISQFDFSTLLEVSALLGIDAIKFAKQIEEVEQKDRAKMQKGFNSRMRSEAKRLKSFVTYESYSSWTPQEMASAGFYLTGVKSGIQCFCCSLILFGTSLRRCPMEDHKRLHPDCEFLLGKDVGNIPKYDARVKYWDNNLRSSDKVKYQEEEVRLASFKNWPFYAQGISPRELSAAGFVSTGKKDTVQCFSCGGCLGNWEEGDDPWKEHAKWFPKCEFLLSKKTSEEIAQYIESYEGFVDVTGEHFVNSWVKGESPVVSGLQDTDSCFPCREDLEQWQDGNDPLQDPTRCKFPDCQLLHTMKSSAEVMPYLPSHNELSKKMETTTERNIEASVAVSLKVPELLHREAQWFQEAKSLNDRLRAVYTDANFQHMSLLENASNLATNQWLCCDLSISSKPISTHGQEPLTLPEVFAKLNSVMCVKGEAGSGKSVFLKKIALLWASGHCPLLNRFQLVFYLSLSSARPDNGLANLICDQLLKSEGSVTEMCITTIIKQLKNQVLFLLDDYRDMSSTSRAIEKLIKKNYLSKTCLLIAVCIHRARSIHQYLDTVLEIKEFPFYNTIYMLRVLFPHNRTRLQKFMVFSKKNSNVEGIQKTPLFVAAICANWCQHPSDQPLENVDVFKSYVECLFLKHQMEADLLKATVSSCGQLALKGVFSSCFEFSDDDLTEAGVDETEDLAMYLMNKFTAQRLRPVYRFLNPAFQEFLAGRKLVELLDSDRQEDQDLGLYYLKQINSSMKALGLFSGFMNYVSGHPSTKGAPQIVSHLLHLADDKQSLETISENDDYLKHHPEMPLFVEFFRILWQLCPQDYLSLASEHLLILALKIAYQSNAVAACSPVLLQFLQKRTLKLNMLSLQYFFDHPESLLLLKSIRVSMQGNKTTPRADFSLLETCFDKSQAPTIDEDYASVFEPMEEFERSLVKKENEIRSFRNMQLRSPPDLSTGYWALSCKQYKIPLLEVHVIDMDAVDQGMLKVLMTVFSTSEHIHLRLDHSSGFTESIRPALELFKASLTACSISRSELSAAEQELLLTLPSLESLEVLGKTNLEAQIFTNLDKVPTLRELSVDLHCELNVFSIIPEEFPNLHHMEKLVIRISAEYKYDPSKLVKVIQNSPNLRIFHLDCNFFSDFNPLMTALASCKKLEEIKFSGTFFKANPFVIILPNFTSLKILKLSQQQFPDKEVAEKFAYTLGSLNNLEKLILPTGDGIYQVAKLIIQQCQQLRCLQGLSFFQTLNDDSVMEIAKAANNGGFQKLKSLNLSINHKITEEGYKTFFQELDNLPSLQKLNILRHFTECIKSLAPTVKALSQCVSRLPNLLKLDMYGWLLDAEDIALLDAVKERHPQSKCLVISWKWKLPFSPIIQK
ncbi:baculoviral IAP repeat-containing protein 1 [Echinops telfairi]|uniref:Baculoviral IAP repeat-containing protein 1 n=1 Tax=Echinops telfairi TaxID=9371 RepID=A0ABM0IMW9_ECHTE|nr:baculoviral IAP repeat-containing protein 1 [Echinops telfairi]